MKALHLIGAGLALLSCASAASAQSALPGRADEREARIQVGLVVPLGSAGNEVERAPRVEAWSEQGRRGYPSEARLPIGAMPEFRSSTRIGLTLSDDSRLTFNGREARLSENRRGISTLGVVGIVVAVGAVTALLVASNGLNISPD